MGIPLLKGRVFAETDNLKSTPVVIVNERFAVKHYPGQDVIGKRIKPGIAAGEDEPKMCEIIGVVGNVKHGSLRNDFTPEFYLPLAQVPIGVAALAIRTNVENPTSVTSAITAELAKMDRNIPLTRVRVFQEYLTGALARPRFNAMLLTIFAGVALLLTAIGIYGVMAYSVAQRTSEIGVRMALGAGQSSIFRLVVGQAMKLVGFSIVLGLAGAFAATRLMNSLLFGVSAWDPVTFAVLAGIIALVAFLAAWLPARRAARVDPVVALRAE
jgi:putative ABC transport system permease protein